MQKYAVIEKSVGQTPLEVMESWRAAQSTAYKDIPLAYAGRLDPMASGKLLVLIGEECKRQTVYHKLDKTYEFEVLFGVQSDSGDVLGLISGCSTPSLDPSQIKTVTKKLKGEITLPYPKFSSKTVNGKPLHTWTLEGKLDEISIPSYTAQIYKLKLLELQELDRDQVIERAIEKINTIPKVTDERKAIGNDFRRTDVRATWQKIKEAGPEKFMIAKFSCTGSSGLYMRTLAEEIAEKLGTCGLAYSIHRTQIGKYQSFPFGFGFWKKLF